MFGAAKGAELFPVVNDALSQALPNSGELFQLDGRGGIDIRSLSGLF